MHLYFIARRSLDKKRGEERRAALLRLEKRFGTDAAGKKKLEAEKRELSKIWREHDAAEKAKVNPVSGKYM